MPRFLLAPCVEEELGEIWQFIARDNPEAASRVVEAAYTTFKALAQSPSKGKEGRFKHPALKDIRSYRIVGFDNYLIFYRPIPDGIQILHVFHGARDIQALFGNEALDF